jgi:hypothetical protein
MMDQVHLQPHQRVNHFRLWKECVNPFLL